MTTAATNKGHAMQGFIQVSKYTVSDKTPLGQATDMECPMCDALVQHTEIIWRDGKKFARWVCE